MDNFYLISQEEANAIGRFEYEPNKQFDPFVGQQEDGSFIVSEDMYKILKDTDQFSKVNFTDKKLVTKTDLKFKVVKLIPDL